ncbi:MAG: sodium:solute symporter family protein [Calditrichaeota bacterium]|nr:sodium:solute symporter family protein [Calditrichota bacterium]MCB9366925.1 sodium:solute symporter family protein [Calditrichota bacterium]
MTESGLAHASTLDLTIVAVSVLAVFALGVWKPSGTFGDYLIAGRKLSAPAFMMSLVTSWYGGILGVSEYSYLYGLSNWFVFGVPYYLYALLFALFLAKRARHSELLSLPDRFASAYGERAAKLCGGIIFLTTMPAAYLLMLGKLLQWMFGWSYPVSLLVGTAASTLYLFRGGLRSVVRTDMLQFLLMYAGFAVMIVALFLQYGGLSFIQANAPRELLTPTGGQTIGAVLVWYFIASTALIEPLFYERAFAAKSERIVLPGMLAAIFFWAVFDFMTTSAGLYARVLLGNIDSPIFAFPELASRVLPAGLFGLFLAALIATVASSIDSYMFLAGAALGRDVLGRRKDAGERELQKLVKIGSVVAALLAFALALFSESVITLWHAIGSIAAPALLLPALFAWFSSSPPRPATTLFSMLGAGSLALMWRLSSFWTADGSYWIGIEPIYVGLVASALIIFAGSMVEKRT